MVDDFQFLDIAQNLDAGNRSNDIVAGCPATSVTNDEGLVFRQLEEVVRTAAGVAAGDYAHAGLGAHDKAALEHVPDVFLVGFSEIIWLECVEFGVSKSSGHCA